MSYAKIGLDDLIVPAQIQYGRRVIAGINDNPDVFPTPNPTMAAVTARTDALEGAYNDALAARLVAKNLTQVLATEVGLFAGTITQLASYVDNATNGDAILIERSGFQVCATPTPVGPLPTPTIVSVKASELPGHADLRWKRIYGAKAYNIERAEDTPEGTWKFMGTVTKCQASVNTMVSGKKYWFRIAAVGAAGQSAWSEPVSLIAP